MLPCTAIALSGGIDSLVAAAMLIDQGRRVIALHFVSGYEPEIVKPDVPLKSGNESINSRIRHNLQPLADQLDIPLHIIDLRHEFKRFVVDYFVKTYLQGKTPNPCLVCNPLIKFDLLWRKAKDCGADCIATGHYARIQPDTQGYLQLLRGVDRTKDQSYFLARLSKMQLTNAVLPLGTLTKNQVKTIAREKGLIPLTNRESQDVCFIPNGTYSDFLIRQPGVCFQPGPIEDLQGNHIGRHDGLQRFTIGQRKGINCPASHPYYVVKIEKERNCLVVGTKNDLLKKNCRVNQINWLIPPPQSPIHVKIKIRYRHQAVASTVSPLGPEQAQITFEKPEPAVTPGQGAVFYHEDQVLGGGWIE